MAKMDPDQIDQRLYMMDKQVIERSTGSLREDPDFLAAINEANVGTRAKGYPPIELEPIEEPHRAEMSLGEFFVTDSRDEPPIPELLDERERRRRRPDPSSVLALRRKKDALMAAARKRK